LDKKLARIKVLKVKYFQNTNGKVLRGYREKLGKKQKIKEIYFSHIKYKKIKAWKYHKKMRMELYAPFGNALFVFWNEITMKFRKVTIGEKNYKKIIVPPKIWFGFQGLSKNGNLIVNISDTVHSKSEQLTKDIKEIDYEFK